MNSGNHQQGNRSDRNQYNPSDEHDQISQRHDRNREGSRDSRSVGASQDYLNTSSYGYQNQHSSGGYGDQEPQSGQYRTQQGSKSGSYGQIAERDYSNQSTMPRQSGGRDQNDLGGYDGSNFDRDNTRGGSFGETSRGGYSGTGNTGTGQRGTGLQSGSSTGNRDGYGMGSGQSSTGQHRGKGPKGYSRSDTRIQDEISDRLMEDHDLDASEVQITVKSGEVTLTGSVPTKQCKHKAEEIAESSLGVTEVVNQLRCQRNGQGSKNLGKVDGTDYAGAGSNSSASSANSGSSSSTSPGTSGKSGSSSSSTR